MSEVIDLPCITRLDRPPTQILARAAAAKLKEVIVIGTDQDGELYFASSMPDGPTANWLLDTAKRALLQVTE